MSLSPFFVNLPIFSITPTYLRTDIATPAIPSTVVAADFNGDGVMDLAVADQGITVLMGTGNGNYAAPANHLAGSSRSWLAAADVNGDHKIDIVSVDSYSGNYNVMLW